MSSLTISSPQPLPVNRVIQKNSTDTTPANFRWESSVIPAITALAIGILFIPSFSIGVITGATYLAVNVAVLLITSCAYKCLTGKNPSSSREKYDKHISNNLTDVSLCSPIVEEGIFRGIIQPLLGRVCLLIIPATLEITLLGISLSVASAVAIVATSTIFGALHAMDHKNLDFGCITHVLSCVGGGICLGLLATQFGLLAAIAAHITENTIMAILMPDANQQKNKTVSIHKN